MINRGHWWVVATPHGTTVRWSLDEPATALSGPFEYANDAWTWLYRMEKREAKYSYAGHIIIVGWVLFMVAAGAWVIGAAAGAMQ
jgi:hypothetical protein